MVRLEESSGSTTVKASLSEEAFWKFFVLGQLGAEAICHVGVGSNDALAVHDRRLEFHIGRGLRLFIEEVKGVMVIFLHDVHVFLVEVGTGKAIEFVIFSLMIRVHR